MPTSPDSADGRPRRIFLIGMMGAGKTTIGRRLAERLGWRHLDSDEQVQQATGRTVPEILRNDGEAAFRAEEKRAVADAAGISVPVVASIAGGAVLDPDNRDLLRSAGVVVWLRAPIAELTRRVGQGRGRPLIEDDPESAMKALYAERVSIYEDLAEVVVDNDGPPERVVDRIMAGVSAAGLPC